MAQPVVAEPGTCVAVLVGHVRGTPAPAAPGVDRPDASAAIGQRSGSDSVCCGSRPTVVVRRKRLVQSVVRVAGSAPGTKPAPSLASPGQGTLDFGLGVVVTAAAVASPEGWQVSVLGWMVGWMVVGGVMVVGMVGG